MTILNKEPYWINKDTGKNIYLYIDWISVALGRANKPLCWARGRYQPVKSNEYRSYNFVSTWYFKINVINHVLHMQPVALYDLNHILRHNKQKPFQMLTIKSFIHKGINTVNYPLKFQANVVKSKRYGHIFTFDNGPIKRSKDISDFQKSLPDPGTHPRNHHGPQNDIEL